MTKRVNWCGKAMEVRRVALGLTLDELSSRIKGLGYTVDRSTLGKWETEARRPQNMDLIIAVSRVLQCPVEAFAYAPVITYRPEGSETVEDDGAGASDACDF